MRSRKPKGFGLLLVLFSVLALAVTASVLIVAGKYLENAEGITKTRKMLFQLGWAISSFNYPANAGPLAQRHYETDFGAGNLPATLNALMNQGALPACTYNTATYKFANWCGPYWYVDYTGQTPFLDYWGHALVYSVAKRRVYSIGPNGVDENGLGDDIVQTF